jgi:hypothetical protein
VRQAHLHPGAVDMDQRKLVVLGLPWDTTETTLHVRPFG